jgi:signal transduction histidine kinase
MKIQQKFSSKKVKAAALYVAKILCVAVIYRLAVLLGLKMVYLQINTSPVWPPTGIALAAVLLFGYKIWPGISLGVLFGLLEPNANICISVGIAAGNTLEGLVGAYLLKHFVNFHNPIDRVRDVVGLGIFSALSTTISAAVGTITLILAGFGNWSGFTTWWVGDLLGALVVTPVLLVWGSKSILRARKRRYIEGLILFVLLALGTSYVFWVKSSGGILNQALLYIIFPFVIWAALRFEQHGATISIFIVSGIAIWGTVQASGPFSLESKNDNLVLLQTFLAVVSLTAMILAAATIERRNAADAREQLIAQLEKNNTELERFTYTISHDLRSPLVTIKGFLGMLEKDIQGNQTERIQRDFQRISNAADTMHALLGDLLELSRIGRIINPPEEIDLAQLTREAMIALEGQLNKSNIQVNISKLPIVYADRVRLREVMENLLENAAKYMGGQAVPVIEVGTREQEGQPVIYVKDNGIGIDPKYHTRIFSLFEKLDPAIEGTGIGLAIVKRIVELHGGRIWVESDGPGKGSTFCFTIPDSRK